MVITETRRHDSTWIVEGELKDRSALSDELADFCAQYPIYQVKEAQESLEVTGIQTQGEVIGLTAFSSFNSNSCCTWQIYYDQSLNVQECAARINHRKFNSLKAIFQCTQSRSL